MRIHINDACIRINMERVAGIEPASLAWKARGYSRRRFIIFNVSNSKPNMKLWFHSAPLWKMDRFPDLSRKQKKFDPYHLCQLFRLNASKTTRFIDDPSRRGEF